MNITLCQLQKKCRKKRVTFFVAFLDLTKAFNTCSEQNRALNYTVVKKIDCLLRYSSQDHSTILPWQHAGQRHFRWRYFSVLSCQLWGYWQSCVMAPLLFNIYFYCLLYHAYQENTTGVYPHTRFDDGLVYVHRFRARTKLLLTGDQVAWQEAGRYGTDLLPGIACHHKCGYGSSTQ